MTAPLPRVTDHAVLRFLERARGFDIEAVRQHIAETCAEAAAAGAASLTVGAVRFEITTSTNTVVTCTPARRLVTPSKVARFGGRR